MEGLIITTPDQLRAIVADEVGKALDRAHLGSGEKVGIEWMASHYDVTRRTIQNWLKEPGKLPPRRAGSRWLLSDVRDWDRHHQVQIQAQ